MCSAEGNGSQNPLLPGVPNPDPQGLTPPRVSRLKSMGAGEHKEGRWKHILNQVEAR